MAPIAIREDSIMATFRHNRQSWRTLTGAYQHKGWFFHHVRTFVNGRQTVVYLPRYAWYVVEQPTSEQAQRYTDINTVERLGAEQGLTYTYTNGLVTFHAPGSDKTFNWLDDQGIENTIHWLQERQGSEQAS
jgi:hypothetical protein